VIPDPKHAARAFVARLAATPTLTADQPLRAIVGDPDPDVRLLAQIALARRGDVDPVGLAARLRREPDLAVFAILVARAGDHPPTPAMIGPLAEQLRQLETPAELRAGCAWALTPHAPARAAFFAGALLAEPETAFWLASIVARRGGPLAPLVAGLPADRAADRVAALLVPPL
jgi:hypothetical protein